MPTSIFSQAETLKESQFWTSIKSSDCEDFGEIVYSGLISRKSPSGSFRENTFYLTSKKIIYFQHTSDIIKFSNLSWKLIEPYTEEGNPRKYGFRVSSGISCKYFYIKSSEDLDKWLDHLSYAGIMTDVENDYQFLKQIGTGSFAAVYLAKDLDTKKFFAVKSISKNIVQNSKNNFEQTIREIEIMRQLDHPNIAKLHKIYESHSHIHLIMDYIPGSTLLQRIITKGPLSEEKSIKFIEKLLKVLRYLGQKNIVHRDIKPENILMADDNDDTNFKLIDFGLACVVSGKLTASCGSPGYVAPEILRKIPYDSKVDVFSAGIILFIILSGRSPFSTGSPKETLSRNRDCFINFSDKYWGNISRQAINVVIKLTQASPLLRPSAKEALSYDWFKGINKDIATMRSSLQSPPNSAGLVNIWPKSYSPVEKVDVRKNRISLDKNKLPILGEKNRLSLRHASTPMLNSIKRVKITLRNEAETPKLR